MWTALLLPGPLKSLHTARRHFPPLPWSRLPGHAAPLPATINGKWQGHKDKMSREFSRGKMAMGRKMCSGDVSQQRNDGRAGRLPLEKSI